MDKKKDWTDLHKEEVLSDNSQIENCKQCKDCKYRDDGTVWSNHYTKSCCQMYKYPNFKPLEVIDNEDDCLFYEKE